MEAHTLPRGSMTLIIRALGWTLNTSTRTLARDRESSTLVAVTPKCYLTLVGLQLRWKLLR